MLLALATYVAHVSRQFSGPRFLWAPLRWWDGAFAVPPFPPERITLPAFAGVRCEFSGVPAMGNESEEGADDPLEAYCPAGICSG
jgi:hypothetical protein